MTPQPDRAETIYYKVVRICSGEMISFSQSAAIVFYKIGVTSVRPEGCGPLAIFNDLRRAELFLQGNVSGYRRSVYHFAILCCRAENVVEYQRPFTLTQAKCMAVWKGKAGGVVRESWLPLGTYLADAVTPLGRML